MRHFLPNSFIPEDNSNTPQKLTRQNDKLRPPTTGPRASWVTCINAERFRATSCRPDVFSYFSWTNCLQQLQQQVKVQEQDQPDLSPSEHVWVIMRWPLHSWSCISSKNEREMGAFNWIYAQKDFKITAFSFYLHLNQHSYFSGTGYTIPRNSVRNFSHFYYV